MSGLGRSAYLIGAIPFFYLFLPNYLVGHISLDYTAYLGALTLSLAAALVAYRGLKKWDARAGLLHEGVSENQRFGSLSGMALALGSLLFAILIAVNSVDVPPTPSTGAARPQFQDPQAGEFCPVRLRGVSLLCVLSLHSPKPSVFIGGDETVDEDSCLFYDIQSGRLGMKFLANTLTCVEQRSLEISEKLRKSAEQSH